MLFEERLGGEERRLMHLVPAPAVRLMKRRVLSRPGVNSLMSSPAWSISLMPTRLKWFLMDKKEDTYRMMSPFP
jgi:hypothetical protein